jgi:hypothetical protein
MAYAEGLLDAPNANSNSNDGDSKNVVDSAERVSLDKGGSDVSIGSLTSRYEAPPTTQGGDQELPISSTTSSESFMKKDSSTVSNPSTPASVNTNSNGDKANSEKVKIKNDTTENSEKALTKDNSTAENSERTRRRITENKRVSNKHLKESLNYEFKYPTYKEGLEALLGGSTDPF